MPANRHNVLETIRDKRQWHTPPDPAAAKLGFRGWHSRGYLPHFDMPGLAWTSAGGISRKQSATVEALNRRHARR